VKEEYLTKLPQELKKNVVSELEFIIRKMNEEQDIARKLYFYSAVRGALERAARFYSDKELLVTHIVADVSYAIINDRINHIKAGDTIIPFTGELLTKLIEGVTELKQAIENDQVTYPAAEKMMEAAYVATGPGFYTRSYLDYVEAQQHRQEE
jgi:hypothetical protein